MEEVNELVLTLRQYDRWAWAGGVALIWADIVLPVPQASVITALGIIYGTVAGGLLGSLALVTGGLLGYTLMQTAARRLVVRVVGERSMERMHRLFERSGPWAIVLSRSLPYSIPEALVCVAGLAGMPFGAFLAALTLGSMPVAFVYAAIGAGWGEEPIVALAVSYVLPIATLPVVLALLRDRSR
jgi:uncharacterized membrane protein YdjX (TVP38/TMEM64 family)